MVSTFGDQLHSLLKRTGVSAREVSDAVSVDLSLVYRWLRNERVPSNAEYLNWISDRLQLSESEIFELQSSWKYSQGLGTARLPRRRTRAHTARKLLRWASTGHPVLENMSPSISMKAHPIKVPSTIDTTWGIIPTISAILRSLPDPPSQGGRILISFQPDPDPFEDDLAEWHFALSSLLNRGWNIDQLVPHDIGASTYRTLVTHLDLSRSCPSYRLQTVGHNTQHGDDLEFLIVPGIIALLFLDSDLPHGSPEVLVIKDQDQIDAIERKVVSLFNQSRTYARIMNNQQWHMHYNKMLSEAITFGDIEILLGDCSRDLPRLDKAPIEDPLFPLGCGPATAGRPTYWDDHRRLLERSSHRIRILATEDTILHAVNAEATWLRHQSSDSSPVARQKSQGTWLEGLIGLLESSENFELLVLDRDRSRRWMINSYCLVTTTGTVAMSLQKQEMGRLALSDFLYISDKVLAEEFRDMLYRIREPVNEYQCSKQSTIDWLYGIKGQISPL